MTAFCEREGRAVKIFTKSIMMALMHLFSKQQKRSLMLNGVQGERKLSCASTPSSSGFHPNKID
jgi:hypothetical protein